MEIRVFDDPAAVAPAAARSLAAGARDAIRRRGRADIALSGGRTPAMMLAELARAALAWDAVHLWQVDERIAPAGDPARNLGLLAVLPVDPRSIHPMPVEEPDLTAAAARYGAALPGTFDIVHLGLGDDGHTASWPPGDPVIDAVGPVAISAEFNGHRRMTITPLVANAARRRLVVATGAGKAEMVRRWLLDDGELPISRVATARTVVFLDEAAAASLPRRPAG